MKKNHRSILDTAFCSILSVAMFFSLGVNSIAEESGDPSAAQPGTEVTETVEDPSPEPEPAPEVPAEAAAVTEPEPAPEATPEVTEEVPAAPEETAAPEPTPTEVKAEETAVPEETPAPAESMAPAETAVPEATAEPAPTPEAIPETEEEPADIYMLAGSFYGSTSKMTVTVTYDDHTFPQGTTMRVSDVSHSEAMAAAEQSTEGDEEVIDAVAVDITFLNANNEEIQPEGAVSVSMVPYTPLETTETSTTEVIHKDDSGNTQVIDADASAQNATFDADSFSIYVISIKDGKQDPAVATYKFFSADNQTVISTQMVKDGETVYAPTTPEKSGYKFLGWSTNNGSDAVADPNYSGGSFKVSVSATPEVNLYPVFQQVYYVFFMDDQGRVSTTKEGVSGATIKVSDVKIPLDSTHSVTGWYTEAEFTNKVDSVTLTDHNVTLYPKVEQGHYLYFASGEGASYVEPEFVAANEETKAPAKPTRPGYTFSHWSLSEEGPESEYSFGSTISENTTLYAVWNANTNTKYTVIYWWENANDDNYSYHESSDKSGVSGGTVTISKVLKTYPGFDLNREKTNAANTGKTISGDGSTIINIYYSRNVYQIKFYESTEYGLVFHWYSWDEMTNLRITAKYGANISDKWPASPKTWGTNKGDNGKGTEPYQSGISTMPLGGDNFYYYDQSGRYTINIKFLLEDLNGKYFLDHTDSDLSDSNEWTTTKEDHYDIEGFTYTGNVKDGSKFEKAGQNTYEVSFKYSRNSYSINFVNGNIKSSQTFKFGEVISKEDISKVDLKSEPARPDGVPSEYTFVGWFDNELGVGDQITSLSETMPAHNITLYAKWVAPTYHGKIFLTIDGSGEPQTFDIDYGSTIDEEKMPSVNVPEGYTWVGWATKSGNDFILFNFDTKVYKNITLYPYYVNGVKYSVTYDLGAGTGTVPIDSKKYAENSYADIQSASGITPPVGKTFLYWAAGNAKYYPGDKVKITGDLKLKASYGNTSELTSITYHSNYPRGSGLTDETNKVDRQANNTAITLEKAGFTAPDGYYFAHWKDASGTQYPVGTKIGIDNTSANNLYAVWEKKKEITLKANSGTFTYDGSTHSVSGVETDTFTINGVSYTVSGYTTDSPKKKDAGNYPNNISGTYVVKDGSGADVTDQFTVNTVNGSLTISKRTVTLTSESASKAFDGTPLTKPDVKVGGDGFVDGEVKDLKATGSITKAGSVTNTIEYTEGAGFKAGNYEITKTEGTLTITANTATIKVTADSDSKTYDGKPLTKNTYSITGLPEGFTAVVTVSGSITDAGSAENKVTSVVIKKGNEDVTDQFSGIETASGTLTVTKRPVKLTSESASKAFDGKPLTAPKVTVTGDGFVDGEVKDLKATGTITKAGSVTNTIEYTESSGFNAGNYEITKDEGTLTITQNENEIVVNAKNAEKKYDGSPLTKNEADITGLPDGYTAEVKVTGSITDAGRADNVVEDVIIRNASGNEVTDQFKTITKNNGTLTVTKRSVALTSETVTREYNGTELTAPKVTVTGDEFVDGEVSDLKATGSITKAGSVKNTIEYTENSGFKASNYEIKKTEGTLTITKNADEITVTADGASKTYDGKALTKDTYRITGLPGGFSAVATVSGSVTDAGSAENKVTSVVIKKGNEDVTDQFSNITRTDGKLTVNARKVTLTSEGGSKPYDGTAFTKPTVTVGGDGFVKGEVSNLMATGSITTIGKTLNTITYTENEGFKAGNYSINKTEGTLEITANSAEITVTADSASRTYDGTELKKESYRISGLPEGLGFNAEVKVTGSITDAGETDNKVTSVIIKKGNDDVTDQFSNITKVNGTLTVKKRNVYLKSDSRSKKYDGIALTKPEVTVTGDGFVDGEVSDIEAIGTITDVGDGNGVPNIITYTENSGFKAGNYNIQKDEGTLKITPADAVTITITGNSAEVTYDGKLHTVSGVTVTYSKISDSGAKAAIRGFFAGLAARLPKFAFDVQAEETENTVNNLIPENQLPAGITLEYNGEAAVSGTDAGTYYMGLSENSFKVSGAENYQGVTLNVVDGKLTINPASLTVTTQSAEKVYDGNALTAGGAVSGLVNDETLTLKTTGSQTAVGSSDNTYSIEWNGTAKETNYTVSSTLGKLMVKARPKSENSKSSSGSSTTTFFPMPSESRAVPRTSAERTAEDNK